MPHPFASLSPHIGLQDQVSPHEPTPSCPVFSSSTLSGSGCQCSRNWTCQRHPCRQMQLWVPCPAWCDLLLAPWPFLRFIYFGPRTLSIPAFFREAIPEILQSPQEQVSVALPMDILFRNAYSGSGVEHLPSICVALGLIPSTARKRINKS